jgi:hypothetical protein
VVRLVAVSAPSFAGRGVQFLVLAALAGVLTPTEYGRFAVLQMVLLGTASVVGSTTGSAVNTAAARMTRTQATHPLVVVVTLLHARRRVLLGNALISAAVVVVGSSLLTGRLPGPGMWPVAVIGLASGALPVGEALVAVLAGSGRPLAGAVVDSIRAVVVAGAAFGGGALAGSVGAAAGLVVGDVVLVGVLVAAVRVAGVRRVPLAPGQPTAHDGLVAGVTANVLGQIASWIVLGAVHLVGGPVGVGVYGVATRFASVVTLAPVYFGKTVVGQLAAPVPGRSQWTPRSFVGMLAVLSVLGSAVSLLVLLVGFPGLVDRYPGLVPVTVAVLVATSVRAVLIGVGNVCIARRQWRTWVVADAAGVVVVALGVGLVLLVDGGLVAVVMASAAGFAAGVLVRAVSVIRTARRTAVVA